MTNDIDTEIFNIIDNIDNSQSILISADILESWEIYKAFISINVTFPCNIYLTNFSTASHDHYILQSTQDFFEMINNRYYSSKLLINFYELKISIYNGHTDNISIVICRIDLFKQYFKLWDRYFLSHLKNCGVGFGHYGKRYVKTVVSHVLKKRPLESKRFCEILEFTELR